MVGSADTEKTYLHINGSLVDSDVYLGQIQPRGAQLRFGSARVTSTVSLRARFARSGSGTAS